MLREEVREVGHRQEQRARVREPHGGERERERIEPGVAGEHDDHGCQQHGGGVEGEEDRAERRDHHDQQPEDQGTPASPARGLLGDGREDARLRREFRHDRYRCDEEEDRPDAVPEDADVGYGQQSDGDGHRAEREEHGTHDRGPNPGLLLSSSLRAYATDVLG